MFRLSGEPPFTFTYQRTELVDPKKKSKTPPKVVETHTVSNVFKNEHSIFSAQEGSLLEHVFGQQLLMSSALFQGPGLSRLSPTNGADIRQQLWIQQLKRLDLTAIIFTIHKISSTANIFASTSASTSVSYLMRFIFLTRIVVRLKHGPTTSAKSQSFQDIIWNVASIIL